MSASRRVKTGSEDVPIDMGIDEMTAGIEDIDDYHHKLSGAGDRSA